MTISAKEVQELRKISGAGMMECKSALSEAKGDLDTAFKLLREKGIAKAEKKSSRDANEGLIGIKLSDNKASIVEVNSETDFVSRNGEFHELVQSILDIVISNYQNNEKINTEVSSLINKAVGIIGENIVFKRFNYLEGNLYSYIHNSVSSGLGKIGVIVDLACDESDMDIIGKNICMHIAATNPKSVSKEDFDPNLLNDEKKIIMKQLKETGKPDNIVEKMMDGKINKFVSESTLLGQKFVMDPSLTVSDYLDDISKEKNIKVEVRRFIRFELGT